MINNKNVVIRNLDDDIKDLNNCTNKDKLVSLFCDMADYWFNDTSSFIKINGCFVRNKL
jgi:hypothetical protein